MSVRRSRRLAGLEPEEEIQAPVQPQATCSEEKTPSNTCSVLLGTVGTCLLTYGLGSIVIAFANAPGYILF